MGERQPTTRTRTSPFRGREGVAKGHSGCHATTSLSLPVQLVGAALLVVFSAKLGAPFPHYVNFADDPVGWATNLVFPG